MLTGHDLICVSSIDWDFNWQGHQEIMATFARQGNRVLFIENTGVRMPTARDVPRLKKRLRNWMKSLRGFRQVQERVWVYSPVILPFPYSRLARWVNRRLLLTAIARWMRAAGFHDPIIWTFLPTGIALDLITSLPNRLAVYYCIADFEQLVAHPRKVRRTEQAVVKQCDLVFAQGEVLKVRCRQWNDHVHVFPFGVNREVFEGNGIAGREVPEELRGIPRPIIGYVGGLHRHVDFALLRSIASARRDWSLVLVGPIQLESPELASCQNVFLVGQKPFAELPNYIQAFDVGIIPYVESAYTQTVYPTKLNEYHALGKPVISTFMPEVAAFNERYGSLVRIARAPHQFIDAIRGALEPEDTGLAERRIASARANAWDVRIEEMSELMEEAIRRRSESAPSTWQARLLAAYRHAKRRTVTAVAALTVVYGALFYSPLAWWAAAPLKRSERPVVSDAIIVFAGGVGESGKPGQGYEERVAWAVELYRQGYAKTLVFSSGYTYAFQEPQVMKALAVSLGVPPERIVLESEAANTFQNVAYTNRLLDQQGWTTALLVSSPYHMRRASLVWKAVAPEKRITYVPISESRFYHHGRDPQGRHTLRQATVQQLMGIAHEYAGLLYYWWKRWI